MLSDKSQKARFYDEQRKNDKRGASRNNDRARKTELRAVRSHFWLFRNANSVKGY